jgi:hypothetical protein
MPGEGFYPTSLWRLDEAHRDNHKLDLSGEWGEGPHALLVGFYLQPSLELMGEPILLPLAEAVLP